MELPDELKKLEINSRPQQIFPVNTNPFCFQVKLENSNPEEDMTTKLFGPKCNCNTNKKCKSIDNNIERNIINQTKLKAKLNGTKRKLILKDPILNCLQNCLNNTHVQNTCSRLNSVSDSCLSLDCSSLANLQLEHEKPSLTATAHNVMESNRKSRNDPSNSNEFVDFRNLIEECDLISSHCNIISDKTLIKKNLRNFTTIQSRSTTNPKQLNKISDCRAKIEDEDEINKEQSLLTNPNNPSTSCSQQARINASTSNCDVTIDELASYFETFVHIPKKMSSMAEMMYI